METEKHLSSLVDGFITLSNINEIKRKIQEKENQIKDLPTKCGSCEFWMTPKCNREKTMMVSNGMSICDSFKKTFWIDETIENWKKELIELNNSLNAL